MKGNCLEKNNGNTEYKESSLKSSNVVEVQDSKNGGGNMLYVSFSSDHLTNFWILDSTSSYHMTHNKNWFNIYNLVNYSFILIDNDESYKVVGIRNNIIEMFNGIIRTLCDVRHISDLRKNWFHWAL